MSNIKTWEQRAAFVNKTASEEQNQLWLKLAAMEAEIADLRPEVERLEQSQMVFKPWAEAPRDGTWVLPVDLASLGGLLFYTPVQWVDYDDATMGWVDKLAELADPYYSADYFLVVPDRLPV